MEENTNIVYSSQFNSLWQLSDATTKYLMEDIKMEEGKYFKIPSIDHLRLQLSPSHPNRRISANITGDLNIKKNTLEEVWKS